MMPVIIQFFIQRESLKSGMQDWSLEVHANAAYLSSRPHASAPELKYKLLAFVPKPESLVPS